MDTNTPLFSIDTNPDFKILQTKITDKLKVQSDQLNEQLSVQVDTIRSEMKEQKE